LADTETTAATHKASASSSNHRGWGWLRGALTVAALAGAALLFVCALWSHFASVPPSTCRSPRSDGLLFALPLLGSTSGPQTPKYLLRALCRVRMDVDLCVSLTRVRWRS
jgi:hypothetical protein